MKNYAVVLWVIFLMCFTSCSQTNNKSRINDLTQIETYIKKDSIITTEGNYVVFLYLSDSTYLIKWGQSTKHLFASDTLNVIGSGVFNIVETTKNSILLKQSCGTGCQSGLILSLSPPILRKFLFIITADLKNNLVAYIAESDKSFITVENFITGEKQNIDETNLCPAAFKGECIDSVSFVDRQLFIRWQGEKWSHKQKDTREWKIKIEI